MILRHVTVDCADPYELGTFWSSVTGWPLADDDIPATGRPSSSRRHRAYPAGWVTLQAPEGNEFCIERSAAERAT